MPTFQLNPAGTSEMYLITFGFNQTLCCLLLVFLTSFSNMTTFNLAVSSKETDTYRYNQYVLLHIFLYYPI